jgi:hypothetical protein
MEAGIPRENRRIQAINDFLGVTVTNFTYHADPA